MLCMCLYVFNVHSHTHLSLQHTFLLLATLMTIFLWVVKYLSWIDVSMLKALGSVLTKNEKNSLVPGVVVNYCAGIVFCFWHTDIPRMITSA